MKKINLHTKKHVISLMGKCILSKRAFDYFCENMKEQSQTRMLIMSAFSLFPLIDLSLAKFYSNFLLSCQHHSPEEHKLVFDFENCAYVLRIDENNAQNVKLQKLDNNKVLVQQSFKSCGQLFFQNLVGNINNLESNPMLVSFTLNDSILVILSHMAHLLQGGSVDCNFKTGLSGN